MMNNTLLESMLENINVNPEDIEIPEDAVELINKMPVDMNGVANGPRAIYESIDNITDAINVLGNDPDFHFKLLLDDDSDELTFYVFVSLWREALIRELKSTFPQDVLNNVQ